MITVWGRRNSVCTQRVLWCLEEVGKDYEFILASSIYGPEGHVWKGGKPFGIVDSPEYLQMNPNGTVPTLRDDDTVIWDSNAIILYLTLEYGQHLYRSHADLGRASSWMGWCNTDFGGPIGTVSRNLWRLPPECRNPEKIREAETAMAPKIELVDDQLAKSPFIASNFLSLGDIALAPFVQRWIHFQIETPSVPNVRAWLARLGASSGFIKNVQPLEYHVDT